MQECTPNLDLIRGEWEMLVRKRMRLITMVHRPWWWQEHYDAVVARKQQLEAILFPETAVAS